MLIGRSQFPVFIFLWNIQIGVSAYTGTEEEPRGNVAVNCLAPCSPPRFGFGHFHGSSHPVIPPSLLPTWSFHSYIAGVVREAVLSCRSHSWVAAAKCSSWPSFLPTCGAWPAKTIKIHIKKSSEPTSQVFSLCFVLNLSKCSFLIRSEELALEHCLNYWEADSLPSRTCQVTMCLSSRQRRPKSYDMS